LQQVQSCRKYGLKEVVLRGIGGKSKPLREAGVLHVSAGDGKVKKILCYKLDERVGNTDRILLLSLRTVRDEHRHPTSHGQVAGWNFCPPSFSTGQKSLG
jgi:hypothetical protein